MISIVGAGGKTSLMKRLREELVSLGFKVVVTTSTHILYDPDEPFDSGEDIEKVKGIIDEHGYIVIGKKNEPSATGTVKLSSPGPEALCALKDICDVMLIEADGARRMSIKVPAEHEPVIYPWTDLVISVAGAGTIGKRIKDVAYRPEEFAAFLGKKMSDELSAEDLALIATSEKALRKGVGDTDYRFYLNAIDAAKEYTTEIISLIKSLNKEHGIKACCGSIQNIDKMGAIILAAGLGTRFGGNKLLSEINGRALYTHVLDEMAGIFGYDGICFVTSHDEIAEAVRKTSAQVVINPHPEDGQSSSMRLGLAASMQNGSCLFAVADQPLISRESIERLIDAYRNSDKMMASMINREGDFANPCIFASCYYDELMDIEGDRGGKSVIKSHSDDVLRCRANSETELADIDTGEDLKSFI